MTFVTKAMRTELSDLNEYISLMDATYPNVEDMPAELLPSHLEFLKRQTKLQRIIRSETDLLYFALEYFSDVHNPENDGNFLDDTYATVDDMAGFHREINEIMSDVSNETLNAKVAIAAPRSHAKSTYLSKDFPLHEIIYRKRKYIIAISETPTVAKGNMQWVRDQLKYNTKLRDDFGSLLSPKDQANITDNSEEFIAWEATEDGGKKYLTLMQSASTGQALRGRNFNGGRPDLIILDDLEDARPGGNASTPEQRLSLKNWFSQTVMALGDPKGKKTAFVYMGTTVHFDSLLMNILFKRSDFTTKIYRAIIKQPDNTALWDKARKIYTNFDDTKRLAAFEKFYAENEAELNKGAEVLWGEVQPLVTLMQWKWNNGSRAFNTEYQNNPIDEESQVFNPSLFTYYDYTTKFNSDLYRISFGIDFAMGKERGDYSAIAVVAEHKETKVKYVADTFIERIKPSDFINVIGDYVMQWQPDIIAAEAQQAQEFFTQELKKALKNRGYPADTRVKEIKQRTRKTLRIESMMPSIDNGLIRFNSNHGRLIEQMERFGQGGHDDGPDSLQMAISVLETGVMMIKTINKKQYSR